MLGRAPLSLQTFASGDPSLEARPLDPQSVAAGSPECRSLTAVRSHDGAFSSGLWECTAGTLSLTFAFDELIHVLEGEVTIQADEGTRTLRPGDVAFFPKGIRTTWVIPRFLRKVWVHRVHTPTLAERIKARLVRSLTR